jgi:hypothetical protein
VKVGKRRGWSDDVRISGEVRLIVFSVSGSPSIYKICYAEDGISRAGWSLRLWSNRYVIYDMVRTEQRLEILDGKGRVRLLPLSCHPGTGIS